MAEGNMALRPLSMSLKANRFRSAMNGDDVSESVPFSRQFRQGGGQ